MSDSNKRQTAYAWAKYYEQVNMNHDRSINMYTLLNDADRLTDQLKECCIQLKMEIDCPICYEIIELEQLQITHCGHKYCKNCYERLMQAEKPKCAICRKNLYKKRT